MLKFLSSVVLSVALSVSAVLGLIHSVPQHGEDYTQLRQATWRIDMVTVGLFGEPMQGSCSGTFIKENIMLTAAHCAAPDMKVNGVKATILKKSDVKDLMLLYVPIKSAVVEVGKVSPVMDSKVKIVGYPHGLAEFVTDGTVQDKEELPAELELALGPDRAKFLMMSAMAEPGNSGGGVFQKTKEGYKLVGVVVLKGGNVIIAVHLDEVKKFINE